MYHRKYKSIYFLVGCLLSDNYKKIYIYNWFKDALVDIFLSFNNKESVKINWKLLNEKFIKFISAALPLCDIGENPYNPDDYVYNLDDFNKELGCGIHKLAGFLPPPKKNGREIKPPVFLSFLVN